MSEGNSRILVTIQCLTYNHEPYIRETLDGFVMQKTSFRFEAIVHDDASKDKTADIIREYEYNYPQIIKPIYQKENQYSKGISIFKEFIVPRMRGKYIAVCEGDDYWIDLHKLQKQYNYMESHPECSFCFSNGFIEDQEDCSRKVFIPSSEEEKRVYIPQSRQMKLKESLDYKFVPTASFFYPRKLLLQMPDSYWKRYCAGDLKARLYFGSKGTIYYFDDKMCIYRKNVPNSAMTKWKNGGRKKAYDVAISFLDMIDDFNSETNYIYQSDVRDTRNYYLLNKLLNLYSRKFLINKKIIKEICTQKPCDIVKIIIKCLLSEKMIDWFRKNIVNQVKVKRYVK